MVMVMMGKIEERGWMVGRMCGRGGEGLDWIGLGGFGVGFD